MQITDTTCPALSIAAPRQREEKNLKFANDGSLESVDLMLRKLSIKCYARVAAMGIGMQYEDVLQEMYVSYVKAKAKWRPEGGARFATYCTTVCLNNFNLAIKKMENQRSMGIIKPTDKNAVLNEDGTVKFQRSFGMVSECEFDLNDESGYVAFMEVTEGPRQEQPDYRMESAEDLQDRLKNLSSGARRLVSCLLRADQSEDKLPSLRNIAVMAQLRGDELRQVKIEIGASFGVRWL